MLSIECQLAQAQMSRYLAGDVLPQDSLEELRRHIDKCAECQTFADEERISLEQMLATGMLQTDVAKAPENLGEEEPIIAEGAPPPKGSRPARGAKRMPGHDAGPEPSSSLLDEPEAAFEDPAADAVLADSTPAATPPTAADPIAAIEGKLPKADATPRAPRHFRMPALLRALRRPDSTKLREGARKNARPLLLSVGLAIVLIAMSTFMGNPTKLFGGKAAPAKPTESTNDKAPPPPPEAQALQEEPKATANVEAEEELPPLDEVATLGASNQVDAPRARTSEPAPPPATRPEASPHATRPAPTPGAQTPRRTRTAPRDPATVSPGKRPTSAPRRRDIGTIQVFDAQGRPIDPVRGY